MNEVHHLTPVYIATFMLIFTLILKNMFIAIIVAHH